MRAARNMVICTNVLIRLKQAASAPAFTPHGGSASDRATSLRRRVALGEQALKEDALEAFHRDGTTLRLRHQNGALERADDEACELLYVGIGGQLACIDRCFQAVGYR